MPFGFNPCRPCCDSPSVCDCPVVRDLWFTQVPGKKFTASGVLQAWPSGCLTEVFGDELVVFTGPCTGSLATNSQGEFTATFDVPGFLAPEVSGVQFLGSGLVTPVGVDFLGAPCTNPSGYPYGLYNYAPTTTVNIARQSFPQPPPFPPLELLTIQGVVEDDASHGAGLVVVLSGDRAVEGLSAFVLGDGSWSVGGITGGFTPSGTAITAKVTDWYGLVGSGIGICP